jgi:hypothetical protein
MASLTAEDFQEQQTRFMYYLFEQKGGVAASTYKAGIKTPVTCFQWRDKGYVPSARVLECARAWEISPMLLNYFAGKGWWEYWSNNQAPSWLQFLADHIITNPLMTQDQYDALAKLPSIPQYNGV